MHKRIGLSDLTVFFGDLSRGAARARSSPASLTRGFLVQCTRTSGLSTVVGHLACHDSLFFSLCLCKFGIDDTGHLEAHRTLRSFEASPCRQRIRCGVEGIPLLSSPCAHDDKPQHVIPVIYIDGIACGLSAIGTFHQSSAAFDMLGSNII